MQLVTINSLIMPKGIYNNLSIDNNDVIELMN